MTKKGKAKPREQPFWESHIAPIEGEMLISSYSKEDVMTLTVRHPFEIHKHAGWCWCQRCEKKYRMRRPKTKSGPVKDLHNVKYQAHRDGSLTFYLPKLKRDGHCPSCGRSYEEADQDGG